MKAIGTGLYITINGKRTELPKRTISIVEQGEALNAIEAGHERGEINLIECLTEEYKYLVTLLGQDKVDEIFDGEVLEDIDVSEISLAVIEIQHAYQKRVSDVKAKYALEPLTRPEIKTALEVYGKSGIKSGM